MRSNYMAFAPTFVPFALCVVFFLEVEEGIEPHLPTREICKEKIVLMNIFIPYSFRGVWSVNQTNKRGNGFS